MRGRPGRDRVDVLQEKRNETYERAPDRLTAGELPLCEPPLSARLMFHAVSLFPVHISGTVGSPRAKMRDTRPFAYIEE